MERTSDLANEKRDDALAIDERDWNEHEIRPLEEMALAWEDPSNCILCVSGWSKKSGV